MGLKVYSSQQRRQGPNGAGRIDPGMYQTGDAAATLAATGSVGRSLEDVSAVAVQLKQADVMIDLARRTGERNQLHRDAMRRIADEPDAAAHESIMAEFESSLEALGKRLNGFAADRWQAYLKQNASGWKADLVDVSNRRKKEVLTGDVTALFETAIREKDTDTLSRAASTAVLGGLMTQVQAENELAKGALAIKQGYIVEQLTADLTAGKTTLQQVKDLLSRDEVDLTLPDGRIDRAKLPAETRQAMLLDLTYWHAQQKAMDQERLEAQQEADRSLLFDGLADKAVDETGQRRLFTYEDVQNSSLAEDEKAQFWMAFEKKYNTEKEADNLAFKLSDPTVELEVLRRIDLNDPKQPITTKEIYALAGKGLSIEDAKSAADRLKARDAAGGTGKKKELPITGKEVLEDLDRLYKAAFFVEGKTDGDLAVDRPDDERMVNMRRFVGIRKELTRWMEDNPTAGDAEIFDKYRSLIGTRVEDGLWSRIWAGVKGLGWKGLSAPGQAWAVGERFLADTPGTQAYRQALKDYWYLGATAHGVGLVQAGKATWNDWNKPSSQEQGWDAAAERNDVDAQQVQSMVDMTLRGAGIEPGDGPVFRSIDPEQEPASVDDFMNTVAAIDDEAAALAYYRKWSKKWQ